MRLFVAGLSLALLQPAFPQASATAGRAAFDRSLESLSSLHTFTEVALSPGGAWLAWVESPSVKDKSAPVSPAIYLKDLRNGSAKAKRITDFTGAERGLAWSQSGKLAFFAAGEPDGQSQLYILDEPGRGKPRKITSLKGYVANAEWSPGGETLALLHLADAARTPGPTEATAPGVGVIDSQVYGQRLATVEAASGEVRELTPPETYVYEYDWSPDGRRIVYSAAPAPGDNNWYIARLFTIEIASGAARPLLAPPLQMANPRWSPDGKTIAFIGGLMSDEGVTGGDIYAMPAEGGEPRNLTPGRKSSPNWFRWRPSSRAILFTEAAAGQSAIATLDVATGSVEVLWKAPKNILFSGDLEASAVVRESWTEPPEILAGPAGKWLPVTRSNAGARADWGEVKSLEWKSDAFDVQGWLMFPLPYDPSKRYPMLVVAHGGPASQITAAWAHHRFPIQLLSSQGYFLFFPNPRGSYGQGEAFTRANVKDFGYGDLRDILAGVDLVLKTYPVDEKRLGITGWSYGGFMTMWAVTQTNRFRAAVAGAGLSNWQSYYGENSIDQWMLPYFGASVYDDPAVYAKSSPINFIKNVKTPTLVAVGERDGECPPPQSYEFWHALKTLGVKTELVVYPGEGHGFHDPEHTRDLFHRMLAWFDDNMPAGGAAAAHNGAALWTPSR